MTDDFNSAGNPGNVFMGIIGSGPALSFQQGSSGGVITPNLGLTGLSRSLGPIAGDIDSIAGGTFDPPRCSAGALDATILGGVKLIDLIKAVTGFSGDSPISQVMQIAYNTVSSDGMATDERHGRDRARITPPIPTSRTTHFHWEPDIVDDNPIVSKDPDSTYSFALDGYVTADLLHPQNSTFKLTGDLKGFVVTLMTNQDESLEFIAITFTELSFTAASGQKTSVNVDIANVGFLGVLKFIEQLEEFMDFSGDGGPKITVTPTGVSADLSVALPPIEVGIFSLSNIGIDAGFNLPFTGGPARFRFSFATQDNPFTLAVAIFGGGGFFGIAIGTDGVELIQASFDFGAMAAIDLGVASGSVSLTAGIYFAYGQISPPSTQTGCILTGFVKLDGSSQHPRDHHAVARVRSQPHLPGSRRRLDGDRNRDPHRRGVGLLLQLLGVGDRPEDVWRRPEQQLGRKPAPRSRADDTGTDVAPTFADQMTPTDWGNYCLAFATN